MGFGNALGFGLASGASSFAEAFNRAMEQAQAHKDQMELLAQRKQASAAASMRANGESDRSLIQDNKGMAADYKAKWGVPMPDVRQGSLPPESPLAQRARAPADSPIFNAGREGFSVGSPDGPTPGPSRALSALVTGPDGRVKGTDADLAADTASPFGQALRSAREQAAVEASKANKMTPAEAVVRSSKSGERGDVLERLRNLSPAEQAAAAPLVAKALAHYSTVARTKKLEDTRAEAQVKGSVRVSTSKQINEANAETKRGANIEQAVTRAAQKITSAGQTPTPELIAAEIPGLTPEAAAKALAKPNPRPQSSGEDPAQALAKQQVLATKAETSTVMRTALAAAKATGGRPSARQLTQVFHAMHKEWKAGLRKEQPYPEDVAAFFGIDPAIAAKITEDGKKADAANLGARMR